jgi:hypothetical protein
MFFGERPRNLHKLHAYDPQPARLETAQDFACQSALDCVGLDNDQRAFHDFLPVTLVK